MHEIRVHVAADMSDAEESERLTSRLREELRELDAVAVTQPAVAAPDGAKGDALAWAELVVSLSGSLPVLIGTIRAWRERQRGATVTIERGGDRLTLNDVTAAEQSALVDAWLARHDSD